MTIRQKILGSAALVFLATAGITIGATLTLVQGEYIRIEASNVRNDTARAVDAVGNRIDQLALKIPDWSSWDDTYEFINDHNPDYLESNLQPESLQSLAINFMLFYDAKHKLVASEAVNIGTGDNIAIPPELLKALQPDGTLLAQDDKDAHEGLLATSTDPLLVATRPILRTDNTGPVRGTLVFAQYFNQDAIARLSQLTHLDLTYQPVKTTSCAKGSTCVHTVDPQTIIGSQVIDDIYKQPILEAHVTEPRTIFQETRRTLAFYLAVILTAGLISLITAFITVNQIVRQDRIIRLKNEFFSIASHELRTPLTAIRGNSVMLMQSYGPKNDAEFMAATADIHEASVRLIAIVNDFLDLARLERGQMPLQVTAVNLKDPLQVVVKQLQSVATSKQLYLKSEVPDSLPLMQADPERIQQIIYNLAGNALKFTTQGGVTIKAEIRGHNVVVLVADTGRGMTPAEQKKLFQSFEQSREQDATIGSGLGLYISKLLVEHMGGGIWVESSEPGKGTSLAFSLPLDLTTQE